MSASLDRLAQTYNDTPSFSNFLAICDYVANHRDFSDDDVVRLALVYMNYSPCCYVRELPSYFMTLDMKARHLNGYFIVYKDDTVVIGMGDHVMAKL